MGSLGEGTSSELWASMSVIPGRDYTGSMRHISWRSISLDGYSQEVQGGAEMRKGTEIWNYSWRELEIELDSGKPKESKGNQDVQLLFESLHL